jgi:two-component system response regulator NreC
MVEIEPAVQPMPQDLAGTKSKPAVRLRVVLVEDHVILRLGLMALLDTDPGIEVVGDAGTYQEALAIIESSTPSLIITDIALPDRTGIELITELRARGIDTPVLILTVHKSGEYIRAAFRAGATGFLLKDSTHAELMQGIRAASAGRKFVCESASGAILSRYVDEMNGEPGQTPDELMTDREREVLIRVALGQSNKHAARDLGLSVKTVEKHRSNLMRKLKLHNTASLTMFAIRYGLVGKDQVATG